MTPSGHPIYVASPDGNKELLSHYGSLYENIKIFSFLISFPLISSSAFSGVASSKASGDEDIPGGGVINSEEFIASFYGVQTCFFLRLLSTFLKNFPEIS